MRYLDWDELKNAQLRNERSISFEEVVTAVDNGGVFAIVCYNRKLWQQGPIFV